MGNVGNTNHYTPWKANSKYFIKCKDGFGNLPLPGKCSAIVGAF